jgi:hypothetical protein
VQTLVSVRSPMFGCGQFATTQSYRSRYIFVRYCWSSQQRADLCPLCQDEAKCAHLCRAAVDRVWYAPKDASLGLQHPWHARHIPACHWCPRSGTLSTLSSSPHYADSLLLRIAMRHFQLPA